MDMLSSCNIHARLRAFSENIASLTDRARIEAELAKLDAIEDTILTTAPLDESALAFVNALRTRLYHTQQREQATSIRHLAIFNTVFLPLSLLATIMGMNLSILKKDPDDMITRAVQSVWMFVTLSVLLLVCTLSSFFGKWWS